jgi:hypothetical protein
MTRKLIVLFTLLCLFATPAMANLICSIQPTAITAGPDAGMIVTGHTTLTVQVGDVIAFQLVGTTTGSHNAGEGVQSVKGSLVQKLATVSGTWNTQVKGNLSAVTILPEFKQGTVDHPGMINRDINGDGFALDVGETSAAGAVNYVVSEYSTLAGYGPSGDVMGTFTYTVTDANFAALNGTVLNWLFATNGSTTAKAVWKEDNTAKNSSSFPTGYAPGEAITLTTIPEPATLVLLSMGAMALLLYRRRK